MLLGFFELPDTFHSCSVFIKKKKKFLKENPLGTDVKVVY